MQLAHGRLFEAVCDSKDCGKLLSSANPYVVVKSKTSKGKIIKGAGGSNCIPIKVRCMECDDKHRGIDREAIRAKKEKKAGLNNIIRRAVLKIYKKENKPRTTEEVIFRLKKKSKFAKTKKNLIKRTLKAMKINKELKRSKKKWSMIEEKKK